MVIKTNKLTERIMKKQLLNTIEFSCFDALGLNSNNECFYVEGCPYY